METNKLFYVHGDVEESTALKTFNDIAGNNFTIEELNESSLHGVLYLDEKGIPIRADRKRAEQLSSFKVIPTCVYSRINGRQVCASFMKEGITWHGVYVATLDDIIARLQGFYANNIGEITESDAKAIKTYSKPILLKGDNLDEILRYSRKYARGKDGMDKLKADIEATGKMKHTNVITSRVTEIYNDIYDILLIKENWRSTNRDRLHRYIRALLEKVKYEQEMTDEISGNGYTLSRDRSKCVINTGLIDTYNNDIYIIDLTNKEKNVLNKKLTLYVSKSNLVELGFNKEDIAKLPKAIKFYKNKSELVFNADIDDFDLEATNRLYHIIQERRDRFPDNYRDTNCDIICDKIKIAVSKAIRMSERDYRYVVPMFNIKENKIQYLMPLHLDKSLDEPPELVVVIGEYNGFYNIYTILTIDDAYDNARLLCRPDQSWLRI